MKKLFPIIIFCSILNLKAQENINNNFSGNIYDLKHCLELGLEKNFNIRIIQNEQLISDNDATLGNAGYLPTLDANAGYSGSLSDSKQKLTSGGTNKNNGDFSQTLDAGLNLNWTIFNGFQIKSNYEKLKELQQVGELNTRLTIENFISNISTEYYNYIQQNIRYKNLEYSVELSKERLRIVEARYSIGSMSGLDLQQARVDYNTDRTKLIKQEEIIYSSKVSLNEMMALDNIESDLITMDSIINYDSFLNKDDIWQKTLENNIFLQISKKEQNLSLLDLKTTQSENYPYVKLNTSYGYTRNIYDSGNYKHQDNLGLTYGVKLGYNIFNGFNRKRKQDNAKIRIKNRELEIQQLELSLKKDLANIWMAYQNNIKLINLETENLDTAKKHHEIAMERYKLGNLSGIELREAQNNLLEAEQRLVQVQYDTKLCEISLIQLSGQIVNYAD